MKTTRKEILEEVETLKYRGEIVINNGNVYNNENARHYIIDYILHPGKYEDTTKYIKTHNLESKLRDCQYKWDELLAWSSGIYGNTCQLFKIEVVNRKTKVQHDIYLYY